MNAISDHKFVHHKVHRQTNYFGKTSIEFEIIRTWIHLQHFWYRFEERAASKESVKQVQVSANKLPWYNNQPLIMTLNFSKSICSGYLSKQDRRVDRFELGRVGQVKPLSQIPCFCMEIQNQMICMNFVRVVPLTTRLTLTMINSRYHKL